MSRRPRRNRPPRLDLVPQPSAAIDEEPGSRVRTPTTRRQLLDTHVTGPHSRLSRDAVRHSIRALVNGDRHARMGVDGLDGCTLDEARDALVQSHGWDPDASRAGIDPDRTVAATRAAAERIAVAARAGARVAVATSRPASLLGLSQWVAAEAAERGATLLECDRAAIDGAAGRELWWVAGVAVVTDGAALLSADGVSGADDWLFAVGRPDLVVADRGFAGTALRLGAEVIAWADLDAPALSVAASRGRPLLVVPIDEQRPPAAYEAVAAVMAAALAPDPAAAAPESSSSTFDNSSPFGLR